MFIKYKKIIKKYKIELLLFGILLLVGILTFKSYGMGNDEYMERTHSLVNYKAYVNYLHLDKLGVHFPKEILDLENIDKYKYKYYGVSIQYPVVLVEHLFNFKLNIKTVMLIRQFYKFILFFIATIYLYLLISKYIIKDRKYALFGTLFFILSPRIYGEVFYNILDPVFMSLFIINCYYICKFIKSDKLKILDILKLSLTTALTINTRIIGGIAIFIGIIIKLIINKNKLKQTLIEIGKVVLVSIFIYILITPASWKNPIIYFIDCFRFFFNYSDPVSHAELPCYYFGKWIMSTNLPSSYILVWIFITTPLLYIILFFIGILNSVYIIIKNKSINKNCLILFIDIIIFIMLGFCIVVRPVLYGGWRHLYFLYPLIIINSIIGLKFLFDNFSKLKKIIYIVIIINSSLLIMWMINHHPYENIYFHAPHRAYKYENFEVSYNKAFMLDALKYILDNDNSNNITVVTLYNDEIYRLLPKNQQKRVKTYYYDYQYADYIIRDEIHGYKYISNKCKQFKIKKFDNIRLYTIYKCY